MELKEEYKISDKLYKKIYEEETKVIHIKEYLSEGTIDKWSTLLSSISLKGTEELTLKEVVSNYAAQAVIAPGTQPNLTQFGDETGQAVDVFLLSLILLNEKDNSQEFTYQLWDKKENGIVMFAQFSIKILENEEIGEVIEKYNNNWANELLQVLRVMVPNGF